MNDNAITYMMFTLDRGKVQHTQRINRIVGLEHLTNGTGGGLGEYIVSYISQYDIRGRFTVGCTGSYIDYRGKHYETDDDYKKLKLAIEQEKIEDMIEAMN